MEIRCKACGLKFSTSEDSVVRLIQEKREGCHVCGAPLLVGELPLRRLPLVVGTTLDRTFLEACMLDCRAYFGNAPRSLDAQARERWRVWFGPFTRFKAPDVWPFVRDQWEIYGAGSVGWGAVMDPGPMSAGDRVVTFVTALNTKYDKDGSDLVETAKRVLAQREKAPWAAELSGRLASAEAWDVPYDVARANDQIVVQALLSVDRVPDTAVQSELLPIVVWNGRGLVLPNALWGDLLKVPILSPSPKPEASPPVSASAISVGA